MKTIRKIIDLTTLAIFSPVYVWSRCTGRREMQESYETEAYNLGVLYFLETYLPVDKWLGSEE